MLVYLNGKFISHEQATVSVYERGFLFGDGIYEVIRSYHGYFFETEAHLRRLQHGLATLQLPFDDFAGLENIARRLLAENNLLNGESLIYFQITRGAAIPRKHFFPPPGTPPTVYIAANKFVPSRDLIENGVAVITMPDIRWNRCDLKTINLLPNVLASQKAHEQGADEAIFIHEGVATEASHSNFFAVFDGKVITHPRSPKILPGITRAVVLELCRELRLPLEETPPLAARLPQASELFLSRTTGEVVPIVRLDHVVIADGKPGPITRKLQEAFAQRIAAGKSQKALTQEISLTE